MLIAVALATVGATWIPVGRLGPLELELANAGSLLLLAALPVFVLKRGIFHAPLILNVLMLLIALLAANFALRETAGIALVIYSTAAVLAAYAVANLVPLSPAGMAGATLAGTAGLMGLFALASIKAGVNVLQAFVSVVSFDRTAFAYTVLRPIWNAYIGGGEVVYSASVTNSVAAAFALLFLLSAALACDGRRWMWGLAAANLLLVVALFSSSAVLSCLLGCFVLAARQAIASARKTDLSALTLPALVILLLPLASVVGTFVWHNIESDSASRASRLGQYATALSLIDARPLLGVGYAQTRDHVIHNFLLFSWSSVGFAGLLLSLFVYASAFAMVLDGIAGALFRGRFGAEYMMMATLPLLFLVRISVGGGGGMPAGAATIALGMALLARRRLRESGEDFVLDRLRSGFRSSPGRCRAAPR